MKFLSILISLTGLTGSMILFSAGQPTFGVLAFIWVAVIAPTVVWGEAC